MKGIILAGGKGTRLYPITRVTNKHLLPVHDQPMVYYPLSTLIRAGIKDIFLVTGPDNAGDFMKILGSGKEFGVTLTYRIQDEAGGIAQALGMAESFADEDKVVVILGDNIFEDDITKYVKEFEKAKEGARIFLKEVPDPKRFGVPVLAGDKVLKIEEKPEKPKSNYAVTGLYMYDNKVFDVIKTLKPSGRGELEITDVNNYYIENGQMKSYQLKGFWSDAGTFPSMARATELVCQAEEKGTYQTLVKRLNGQTKT
jgi:glucose-1-phosphate thymidylyltransferase